MMRFIALKNTFTNKLVKIYKLSPVYSYYVLTLILVPGDVSVLGILLQLLLRFRPTHVSMATKIPMKNVREGKGNSLTYQNNK